MGRKWCVSTIHRRTETDAAVTSAAPRIVCGRKTESTI
jgi:hypothetical protein